MLARVKYIAGIALIMLAFIVIAPHWACGQNIPLMRKQLVAAINSGKTTDSLYGKLTGLKHHTPLITGYIATLQALKAKHTWNPYYKVKFVGDAEKIFKMAVAAEPSNIEIRFMRFSVEHNVPGFLGYNKNLNADKAEMLKQLSRGDVAADAAMRRTIIDFLINSKRCTPAELQHLNDYLAAL